jgi:tetratricopeptide (TPR) repeat protein
MKHFPSKLKLLILDYLNSENRAAAIELLNNAIAIAKSSQHWLVLRQCLEIFDKLTLNSDFEFAYAYVRVLVNCGDEGAVLKFTERISPTFTVDQQTRLLLERVWGVLVFGRYQEAEELLHQILENTTDPLLRAKGLERLLWAKHRLFKNWATEEHLVRTLLEGHALGLALIDIGQCFYEENKTVQARSTWLEALAMVEGDKFQKTDVSMRLGVSYLREFELEKALPYLLKAEKDSRHPSAKFIRVRALCSLAALHRVRGEFLVALEIYKQATKIKLSNNDRLEALLNLGRSQRLMNSTDAAIVTLIKASKILSTKDTGIFIELAAAYLRGGYTQDARITLAKSSSAFGADLHLQMIIEAEFLRLEGHFDAALEKLRALPMDSRLMREEVLQFKALFTLARAAGLTVPEPLPYFTQYHFEIFTEGALVVLRNGIDTKISQVAKYLPEIF